MKVNEIAYKRLKSLPSYGNEEFRAAGEPEAGESPEEALVKLRDLVEEQFTAADQARKDKQEALTQRQNDRTQALAAAKTAAMQDPEHRAAVEWFANFDNYLTEDLITALNGGKTLAQFFEGLDNYTGGRIRRRIPPPSVMNVADALPIREVPAADDFDQDEDEDEDDF